MPHVDTCNLTDLLAINPRCLTVPEGYSLAQTCAPVAWAKGRWPNTDWIAGHFWWVGWESATVVWRVVSQDRAEPSLLRISGTARRERDQEWARAILGLEQEPPCFADPVMTTVQQRLGGLRPFAAGNLFDGLVSAIVGQSISVAAAAVTERRLAALFHPGLNLAGRLFYPLPRSEQLAESAPEYVRRSGVTMRRAVALVAAATAQCQGQLLTADEARQEPDRAREQLRRLPLVGPWTAESALLWGASVPDAFPEGDAALLRAARVAFDTPSVTHDDVRVLAGSWKPARAWAARYLWTHLLGTPGSSS